jgi:putative transposase
MIDHDHPHLSVRRQCQLLGLSRSGLLYVPKPLSACDLQLKRLLDEQYLKTPFYGSRRMTVWLKREGYDINRKRTQRLMREMGLEALYPKPNTSVSHPGHRKFPYLLRGLRIDAPNQVWSTDITYIPLAHGFIFLAAVIDWYSRYVLSWEVSLTLETGFCTEALDKALQQGTPKIFNTDQGCQFTSQEFTERVLGAGVQMSMDGRGRALDNVFVERLWRSVKYENVYLLNYREVPEAIRGLGEYFTFYNNERPHQSLGYRTPHEVHVSIPQPNVMTQIEKEVLD